MKPLNKKLIPYSKAFKQVSNVIGKEEALKQLGLVWDCPECFSIDFERGKKSDLSYGLMDLFLWDDSPQGHEYWSEIHCQYWSDTYDQLQLKDD